MKVLVNKNNSEENITIYLMEEHGYAFCMLTYYEVEKHRMYLSNLNVKEDRRRDGYGGKMLDYAIEYAHKNGCKYLYLYVVDGDSWIAKWYKRKGFIPFKKSSDGSCDMFLEINKK